MTAYARKGKRTFTVTVPTQGGKLWRVADHNTGTLLFREVAATKTGTFHFTVPMQGLHTFALIAR